MRYDLAFLVCCCKSFLGDPNADDDDDENTDANENTGTTTTTTSSANNEDYYHILGLSRQQKYKITSEDIKRAYKKQSLLYHPDKLLQRNIPLTPQLQLKFTNVKEAYDVLIDPNKRETYNLLGKQWMKFIEEPFSSTGGGIDPQDLLQNFAKSSIYDRSKIFLIFVIIAFIVLIQPILICIHIDRIMTTNGDGSSSGNKNHLWVVTFLPLWIFNLLVLVYHVHLIHIGPITRPDHIPANEIWIDPLPMSKRYISFFRFLLILLFEILLVLKWDHFLVLPSQISFPYYLIFVPYYVLEIMTLIQKYPISMMRIVTIHDLEVALGKPFSEFTMAEKQLIASRYTVVSSIHSTEYNIAHQLKLRNKQEIQFVILRLVFVLLLIVQLDVIIPSSSLSFSKINYFIIFIPIFLMSLLICCTHYYQYIEIRKVISEKDPTFFHPNNTTSTSTDPNAHTTTAYGAMDTEETIPKPPQQHDHYYSSPPVAALSPEERELCQQQLYTSYSKFHQKCTVQTILLVLLILSICKLQGATYTSFLLISPFLLTAGMILCCIGCAIFGVTEVPTDGIQFGGQVSTTTDGITTATASAGNDFQYMNAAETGTAKPNHTNHNTTVHTSTTNHITTTTTPMIIPPPPAASTPATNVSVVPTDDKTVERIASADNNDNIDHSNKMQQQLQDAARIRTGNSINKNELAATKEGNVGGIASYQSSGTATTTTTMTGVVVVDPATDVPVAVVNDTSNDATTTQSPPSSVSVVDDHAYNNDNTTPKINELD